MGRISFRSLPKVNITKLSHNPNTISEIVAHCLLARLRNSSSVLTRPVKDVCKNLDSLVILIAGKGMQHIRSIHSSS